MHIAYNDWSRYSQKRAKFWQMLYKCKSLQYCLDTGVSFCCARRHSKGELRRRPALRPSQPSGRPSQSSSGARLPSGSPGRLAMFILTFFSNFRLIFGKLWEARSGLYRSQLFASKYSFESSWRDIQDLHTFASFESNLETMKSASGKRPPDKTAPHSKIRLNFVKHVRVFAVLFSIAYLCFAILVQNSPIW